MWLFGWILATGLVVWHGFAVERYLDRVSETRFGATAPVPMTRVPQYFAPDGQMWMRESLDMVAHGEARLRTSRIDDAPGGRDIYWNSGWAWWLVICAKVRVWFTAEPLSVAMEHASIWANVPLWLCTMTLASVWAGRRWGGAAGACMALGLAGTRMFYGAFYPAYADHHGMISAAILGLVLGAIMGASRVRGPAAGVQEKASDAERMAKRAMVLSALCGAVGMWASAASLVTVIAFIGCGAMIAAFLGTPRSDTRLYADLWRTWGRVGALASSGFYLLENFPDRLGLRLEANHPLYAVAWWAGGELVASVIRWREERQGGWIVLLRRSWVWLAILSVVPAVIVAGGSAVFAPADGFLSRIHSVIHEFESLPAAIGRAGWAAWADTAGVIVVVVTLGCAAFRQARDAETRRGVLLAGVVAAVMCLQGFVQNRWLLTAGGPVVVLATVATAVLCGRGERRLARMACIALLSAAFAAGPCILIRERLHVEKVRDVQMGETVQLLYRDIAAALRGQGADDRSVLLSDPNASVGVGYYGGFRSVGTLYWENGDGLRAAAEILCAHDDAEAAARVHARGISHVVLVSTNDFLDEYAFALDGVRRPRPDAGLFGRRLLYGDRVPLWLRPLDYDVPAPLAPLGFKVAAFAVDFAAPPSEAHERIGLYQWRKGATASAEQSLMAAIAADSGRSTPWLLLGRLFLSTDRPDEAFNFISAGIARSPAEQRGTMSKAAAALFARAGHHDRADAFSKDAR